MSPSRTTRAALVVALGVVLFEAPALRCQQSSTSQSAPAQHGQLALSFGPTTSNPEGKAAAEKLLQAMGGAAKVNAIKTVSQSVAVEQQGQKAEIEQVVAYPDKQMQRIKSPQGTMTLVVTPTDAFMSKGNQVQQLSDSQRTALDVTLRHDFIHVLQHINDPKYIFSATGQEKTSAGNATVVDVEADGVPTRWWIATDGKLLQERYYDTGVTGNVQIMTYSDWKNYGGLQYPTKYELFNEAGQPLMSMTLTRMQLNPAVSPGTFERPGR